MEPGHHTALLDWLACAAGGAGQRAARAVRGGDGAVERAAWLGTAGHVLDFDDTWMPGVAHLSAPTAPAAIALGAELERSVGDVLAAYVAGFEAMAAVAGASHPALYDRGFHPTAVCGAVGAAVTAAALLGLDAERTASARRLALLQAGGLRAAFGSDGKALQVGMAAAAGVLAARAAAGGAEITGDVERGPAGFEAAFGGTWAQPNGTPAVAENWIKPWPCCLFTHGAVEAAARVHRDGAPAHGPVTVTAHPRARRAAAYDDVADGLQAKFSFPYLVAFALLRGEPGVADLAAVDEEVRAWSARHVRVATDAALPETAAVVAVPGREPVHVERSLGSPGRPLGGARLAGKLRALAGERLDGVLDDPALPATALLAALEGVPEGAGR